MATMHLSVTDENWVYFPGLSLTTLFMYFYGNDLSDESINIISQFLRMQFIFLQLICSNNFLFKAV